MSPLATSYFDLAMALFFFHKTDQTERPKPKYPPKLEFSEAALRLVTEVTLHTEKQDKSNKCSMQECRQERNTFRRGSLLLSGGIIHNLLNVFVPYPSSPIPRMSYWPSKESQNRRKRGRRTAAT